ncbi:D-alanyl-D-alanine carboxypeptidase/D-alanyl-D-alanine endopeptidase [Piscinibacter koreensis]|uniref:D-alanyl-D-alanine carboxypeptidase/D-alanyl-D-alanine-endopeptidase n=1 Tax=Piscinibacter koreensis TaxID=2742824 RepID=A0A7Y6TWS9_9BURK|nr:D-alanyl-D-alanine carboxypeptidase/D-alanyl-D-alanine-endopeptidase [Schlegelella koreensis]NUZ06454.1 D-alanyl-D-alanine carboxypeptidase/D-alanyl-D-alanine-endopeptidase [Schlegelella koreensis]
MDARTIPVVAGGALRRLAVAALVALAGASAAAAPRTLPAEVDAALARADVPRDAFVAVVQEVGARTPRLAWRTDVGVNPASLMKLLTTFAALDMLGPAYTWSTPVWLNGRVDAGVLNGDLVIKGSGDPKLVLERVWLLLRRVQQLGVREIRGDIVLDRSAFWGVEQNPGDFDGEALRPYNVAADALLINYKSLVLTFQADPSRKTALVSADPPLAGVEIDATVPLSSLPCDDWRAALKADFSDPKRVRFDGAYPAACAEKSWPIAYADPRAYNERVLAAVWRDLGGTLTGRVRDGSAPATAPTFESRSPTLAELVRDINKFSNNVMAQQVFLTLAATQRGAGSPEAARDLLRQWLDQRLGASAAGAVIVNGSGLARETRISAGLLARLLQVAWASPLMSELMSSLPVSGVDGTLRRSRAPLGRAHLKTGSLRDVTGIAGYVLAASGRRYVVVGIVNHPNAGAARPALDALGRWAASDGTAAAETFE